MSLTLITATLTLIVIPISISLQMLLLVFKFKSSRLLSASLGGIFVFCVLLSYYTVQSYYTLFLAEYYCKPQKDLCRPAVEARNYKDTSPLFYSIFFNGEWSTDRSKSTCPDPEATTTTIYALEQFKEKRD